MNLSSADFTPHLLNIKTVQKTILEIRRAQKSGACVLVDAGVASRYKIPADYVLPAGEAAKRWAVLEAILHVLAARKHERGQEIWVVGGGGASDVGALAASLYRRGCPLVLVPTTLLSAVDASVGGKTAIDHLSHGHLRKNFAGTFYPASKVLLCPEWWRTLSEQERRSGIGELLKIFWLEGKKIPEKELLSFQKKNTIVPAWSALLKAAVQAKLRYVVADPFDSKGQREALNYGHTLGHAFESAAKGKLAHGEAVAWGMWAETLFLRADFATDIHFSLTRLGFTLPGYLRKISADQWEDFLGQDKKMQQGKLLCSILVAPGKIKKVKADPKVLARFTATLFAAATRRL